MSKPVFSAIYQVQTTDPVSASLINTPLGQLSTMAENIINYLNDSTTLADYGIIAQTSDYSAFYGALGAENVWTQKQVLQNNSDVGINIISSGGTANIAFVNSATYTPTTPLFNIAMNYLNPTLMNAVWWDGTKNFWSFGSTYNGGAPTFSTYKNTLDDGAGAATFAGDVTATSFVGSGTSLTGVGLLTSTNTWTVPQTFAGAISAASVTSNGFIQGNSQVTFNLGATPNFTVHSAATPVVAFRVNGTYNNGVETYKNVLDDGAGNMTIAGDITATSFVGSGTSLTGVGLLTSNNGWGSTNYFNGGLNSEDGSIQIQYNKATSGSNSSIYFQEASGDTTTNPTFFWYLGQSNPTEFLLRTYDGTNFSTALQVNYNGNAPSLSSNKNILDNGSTGAATFANTISAMGASFVNGSTEADIHFGPEGSYLFSNTSSSLGIYYPSTSKILLSVDYSGNLTTLAGINGVSEVLTGTLSVGGEVQVTGSYIREFYGASGNYSNTGTAAWGGPIWGIDTNFTGGIGAANWNPSGIYGIAWQRASSSYANNNIGEGLYTYVNGTLYGGFGTAGGYANGTMSATSFNSLSSARYKEDIEDLEDSTLLDKFSPKRFRMKVDHSPHLGFIVEETHQFIPELSGMKDGVPDSFRYDEVIPLLVARVKKLTTQVAELERQAKLPLPNPIIH